MTTGRVAPGSLLLLCSLAVPSPVLVLSSFNTSTAQFLIFSTCEFNLERLLHHISGAEMLRFLYVGAPYQSSPLRSHHQFKPGDHVKVNVGLMKFREMQAGHGAWADEMTEVNPIECLQSKYDGCL